MRRIAFPALALTLILTAAAVAQDTRYGVGVFLDRGVPVMGFNDRYPASQIYGIVFDYDVGSRATLEFEYHHTRMTDGKIEDIAFLWPTDKKKYLSPDASSEFNLNSFLVNALAYLRPKNSSPDLQLLPYVAVGAGLYDYQDEIKGLIFPGQRVEPLDPGLQLDPRQDEHTALGTSLGLGVTIRQDRFGLDVRGRYHVILGDLRPMEAWGLDNVFPITVVDLRTTFKMYW